MQSSVMWIAAILTGFFKMLSTRASIVATVKSGLVYILMGDGMNAHFWNTRSRTTYLNFSSVVNNHERMKVLFSLLASSI